MRIPTFKDLTLYVAISTLIIGGVCVLFYAGMSLDFFTKWVCFAVMTAFLFGLFIENSPTLRHERTFWSVLIVALLVHCGIWATILVHAKYWKFPWFYPMVIEMIPLQFSRTRLQKKLRKEHQKQHRKNTIVHREL
jgi:hypothetical protein